DGRIVHGVEEALQVVGGEGGVVGAGQRGGARLVEAIAFHREHGLRIHGVAAGGVVERTGQGVGGDGAAGGGVGPGGADGVAVDGGRLGIEVPARDGGGGGAARVGIRHLDARLPERPRQARGHHGELAVAGGGGIGLAG